MVDFRAKHGRVAASILLRHWFRVNLWTLDMSEKTAIPRFHSWSWCSRIFGEKHAMLKPMVSPMFWHIHHILLRSLYFHHIHVALGFIPPKNQRMFYHNRSWLSPKKSRRFGTWILFFHSVGNVMIPTDELHHFSEGLAATTNQETIV